MCLQQGQAKSTYGTGCFLLYNTGTAVRKILFYRYNSVMIHIFTSKMNNSNQHNFIYQCYRLSIHLMVC